MNDDGLGDVAAHLLLIGGAIMAAVLRLASYSGPPRPIGVVFLDGIVMMLVAMMVGEVAVGAGANAHLAVGLGISTGLVGWETVKAIALRKWNDTKRK